MWIDTEMQRPKQVSNVLLRNMILQTDAHNRAVEEEECWRQYEAMRFGSSQSHKNAVAAAAAAGIHGNSPGTVRTESKKQGSGHHQAAHMDNIEDVRPYVYTGRDGEQSSSNSTFWLRKLDAAESADPNRWGHSGYKELYPDDFKSSSDSDADTDSHTTGSRNEKTGSCHRHRKRKRLRSVSPKTKRVHKHKSKHKKKQHRHKKKKRKKKTENNEDT